MITPSFGLTATERVLPKLALDFTTASLDSRITFTRTTGASNPATFVNSSGYVTAATNNQPRFDYDPVSLACKGLLIEESRSNLMLQSANFNTANWVKSGLSPQYQSQISPDGTQDADFIREDSSSGFHFVYQAVTLSAGSYSWSMYIKPAGRSWLYIYADGGVTTAYVNLTTGALGTVTGTPTITYTSVGNGWYRLVMSYTGTITTGQNMQIRLASANGTTSYQGDGTSGVYLWGAQLEVGAFATSYIPTTTTALTRNADVATMTGANFSDWFHAGAGAFGCSVLPKTATGTKPVLQFDDATALNIIATQGNATATELKITTLGVLQSTLSTGTITANTAYGSCGAWTAGPNALSKSGGAATTGSPVSIPTVTQSRLGSDGTNYFNGWLQKINYWPQRLTNSEVQAFSK